MVIQLTFLNSNPGAWGDAEKFAEALTAADSFQPKPWDSPGLGFRILGVGFRVLGFGFRVLGLGFGVWALGFRVLGFGFWVYVYIRGTSQLLTRKSLLEILLNTELNMEWFEGPWVLTSARKLPSSSSLGGTNPKC